MSALLYKGPPSLRRLSSARLISISLISLISLWSLYSFYSPDSFGLHRPFLLPPESDDVLFDHPQSHVPPVNWTDRAEAVKASFLHAWEGYVAFAITDDGTRLHDELLPVSNWMADPFNGWGVTLYDSLSTLHLMGLHAEFSATLPFIERATFSLPSPSTHAPFFETVIRYLGGLLSAYSLSHEPVLLTAADRLGSLLSPAFSTPSGLPAFGVNTDTGTTTGPTIGVLAEVATCQMEYAYLAHLTHNKTYYDHAQNILNVFSRANTSLTGGAAPTSWNLDTGEPFDTHVSMGGQADSAHEYWLKSYLLTAQKDPAALKLYIDAMNFVLTDMLYVSPTRGLLYVTDVHGAPGHRRTQHNFEHLSCFLPGLLALGAHTLPLSTFTSPLSTEMKGSAYHASLLRSFPLRNLHLWAAEGLAQTCYLTYADQSSGLGPEGMVFSRDSSLPWASALALWKRSGGLGPAPGTARAEKVVYTREERLRGPPETRQRDYSTRNNMYLLRPETVESLYLMWRVTGEVVWRERAWEIYEAIERGAKTVAGYGNVVYVDVERPNVDDSMPSYFMAETLKYLYLTFTESDPLPLDKWVFNTEAHPFPVFSWSEDEVRDFGIEYGGAGKTKLERFPPPTMPPMTQEFEKGRGKGVPGGGGGAKRPVSVPKLDLQGEGDGTYHVPVPVHGEGGVDQLR